MTFWYKKKVLITGHTGFKGSWLSLWLQSLGSDVVGYALAPPTDPSLYQLAHVADNMVSIHGDIRDYEAFYNAINIHQPEIIFHMAAQPLVLYSYSNPIETYTTNVIGTVNLLEAVRQTKNVRVVVNVTTDKCYENNEWHWGYRESDKLGGYDPYSNSKSCSELVTSAYRNSYFTSTNNQVGLATARAGNVIGGGDWSLNRLIPDIMRACINDYSVSIRNPDSLRPWQHVLEPLSGYMLLAQRLYSSPAQYADSWNFGPNANDVKPVSWIADFIHSKWHQSQLWKVDNNKYAHETVHLQLDCSKAKAKLGWCPKWNLDKGLEATVNWYQSYQAKCNMRDITLNQINDFIIQEI